MATNQTLIHYALDLETPPVIACDTPAKGIVHTTFPENVTCPRCMASEQFPVAQAHRNLGRMREERALIRPRPSDAPIVTPYVVLMEAASLLSDDGENAEYDRAIVELTGNLIGAGPDDRLLMQRILRSLKNGE